MFRFIFVLGLGVILGIYLQEFPEFNDKVKSILPDKRIVGEKLSQWGEALQNNLSN